MSENKMSVIVAEDEELVRKLTAKMIRSFGYKTYEAKDGKEACRLFDEHSDEIIFLVFDIYMPEMGGIDAYEYILSKDPGLKNKIIFLTGYGSGVIKELEKTGKIEYIFKPFSNQELLEKIETIIKK